MAKTETRNPLRDLGHPADIFPHVKHNPNREDQLQQPEGPLEVHEGQEELRGAELEAEIEKSINGQLSVSAGGKTPTNSYLALSDVSRLDLGTDQFEREDEFYITLRCKVRRQVFDDKEDKATGQVVETDRVHLARVLHVVSIES